MPSSDYTPDIAALAKMLRARTVDDDGQELGVFNADTRPTAEQAQEAIDEAVGEVSGILGDTIPERLWPNAASAVKLLSAMNVELTYYPEQVAGDHSPYPVWERRYNAMMDLRKGSLVLAVKDEESGGPEGPDDDVEPMYAFPPAPVEGGDLVYDPNTQSWQVRQPAPYADEGTFLGSFDRDL